jgi:hypothetical protein
MRWAQFAVRLVAHGGSLGIREELIGDVLEEIARGRSRRWVCRQLIGLYALAFVTEMRHRARLTPHAVALVMGVVLLAAASMASAGTVLVVWLGFYYVAGTLSLFAHMASHTIGAGDSSIAEPPATS